jgi:ABC-type Zn uptake system ZnuABC Zn-binding protein ZnuA
MKKIIPLLTALLFLLTACAQHASNAPQSGPVILASATFLADIAQNVAGGRLTVTAILPIGVDPHSFQPTPSDVARISENTVLIVNGLEYEHFLEPVLENAGGQRLIITATQGLTPREMEEHEGEEEHEAGDPHMWLDPVLAQTYVENIRAGLTEADPQGASIYQANADAYIARLNELDAWIVEQVTQIPAGRRLLVTNHEALGYFADRYGFQIAGTVLTNVSSAASVSARELSVVIDEIESTGAPAIFLDEVENPNFAQQIAEETGVIVVDDLHLESLMAGEPAATYLDMMRYNVSRIVEALK